MGYVLRVRLASFFAGAATMSFIGLSVLYKDYKVAHESISQQGSSQPVQEGTVSKAEATEKPSGAGVNPSSSSESEFKVMAADASVFSFGDEDDFESD